VAQRPLKRLNARSGNSCRPRDRWIDYLPFKCLGCRSSALAAVQVT
jgi:hypothetical protein